MTTPPWVEITCQAPAAAVDLLADFLVELSGRGVCTDNRDVDTFTVEGLDDGQTATIKAYLPADVELARHIDLIQAKLRNLEATNPDWLFPHPVVSVLRDESWAESWKEYFKPFRVGERLVVKPTWESYAAAGNDIVLEIDPGMAFGTGSHATTRLCLEAIEGICRHAGGYAALSHRQPVTLLDVGTGSGILGIGALKLGIIAATGIDIDPEAVAVAVANASLNGVGEAMIVSTAPLEHVAGIFDVVVANILAEELVRLAALLVERTSPGGFLILSGILIEKESLVIEGFASFPLAPLPPARQGEWSCLVYRHLS